MPSLLITGAAGYIGSHFAQALIGQGVLSGGPLELHFLDDLSTGHREFLARLVALAESKGLPRPKVHEASLTDAPALERALEQARPEAVLHFAALISVAESVQKPELYFRNNVEGSQNLLRALKKVNCRRLVFSSTAAVYGNPQDPAVASRPLPESTTLAPVNPYGETKLAMERAIEEASRAWGLNAVIFRYFNAAGASASGRFGEWHEPETHLIPLLLRAASRGDKLKVFGSDYSTRDGTCIRDYIHVEDLASAHLLGLKRLMGGGASVGAPADRVGSTEIFNLGTAQGTSVLEVIRAAERVLGHPVGYEIHPRRSGDSAVLVADSTRARQVLGWEPKHSSMEHILRTAWAWERGLQV
jgi:UDP-glucose-4-epimerase GalE